METNVQERKLLQVSSSPHVRTKDSIQRIMLDVIIAMIPATIAAFVLFGVHALLIILASVVTCVVAEAIMQRLMKRRISTDDLSAVVTGILLAFNVPSTMPIWMVVVAGVFAIVIVKQIFGGLGNNFMNPALAGRALLLGSWSGEMSKTVAPFTAVDAKTVATPLSGGKVPELWDMFIGKMPGMLGEVSAVALLIGALYLVIRGVIHLRIPVTMIASFAVFMAVFGMITGEVGFGDIPAQILSGGLILGACFMATDYATTPMTAKGQIIFALGAGFLTALIRSFGGFPEGVSYAILLMNVCTPLIDKYVINKPFGGEAK